MDRINSLFNAITKQRSLIVVSAVILVFLSVSITYSTTHYVSNQQYSLLAQSFLNGRVDLLHLNEFSGIEDTVFIDGKYYWILGPLPALLLMPFVLVASWFNVFFLQGYVHAILLLITFGLSAGLARRMGFALRDALLLAFAFCFASAYFGIIFLSTAHNLSHSVTVCAALFALYEYVTRKRWWLIGLFCAAAFATRFSAGLIVLFFGLEALFSSVPLRAKIMNIIKLSLPIIITGFLLVAYNYMRFNAFWDNGYMDAIILRAPSMVPVREQFGLFSIHHVLTNIYYFFFSTPIPVLDGTTYRLVSPYVRVSPFGLSFFIVSPIFIKIFFTRITTRTQWWLWISSGALLVLLLTYFAPGYWQFGPRYMLDLLPLWYMLLLFSFKGSVLKTHHAGIIIASALLNVYLFTTMFYVT